MGGRQQNYERRLEIGRRVGYTRLWEEVRRLRLDYSRLTINFRGFRNYVSRAFVELKSDLCVIFKMQSAAYIKLLIEKP